MMISYVHLYSSFHLTVFDLYSQSNDIDAFYRSAFQIPCEFDKEWVNYISAWDFVARLAGIGNFECPLQVLC